MSRKKKSASRQVARQQNNVNNRRNGKLVAKKRKNALWWWIGGIALLCVLVVGVFIFISNNQKANGVIGPTDPSVLKAVTTVKPDLLSEVGAGGLKNMASPIQGQQPLMATNGKPEFFYYGAEFCPYCAANRWSMAIALSRFGTFTKLPETLSSSTDVDANTATFTFVNSSYTSSYINFVPLEALDRSENTLQTPTASEQQLLKTFNITGFPFLDVANQYEFSALYDPAVLANLSQKDIAKKLTDPNDSVTKNILGGANYLTAAICQATNNQPANVCTQSPIPEIQPTLTQAPANSSIPFNNEPIALHAQQSIYTENKRNPSII